jgi:hypothetical protein
MQHAKLSNLQEGDIYQVNNDSLLYKYLVKDEIIALRV